MFSIIIPSYNRKEFIPDLLGSLEHQTTLNFEVIIVDDCSTQPIDIREFYSFPIQVIRNNENKGAAESRNIGAKHAKNEWLLFLDDDDRFDIEKCEILEKAIEANHMVNFIYHPAKCMMVNENFSYYTHPFQNERDISLDSLLQANKIGGMPMIAIKKSLFLKVGGLSSELLALEDYDFLLKVILDESFYPLYLDQALTICTFYTKRSSVSTNTANTEKAILALEKKYVKTDKQRSAFKLNALYMQAYTHIMNLSRKAGVLYLKIFRYTFNIKFLLISIIIFISPKLIINLKRYI